MQTNRICYCRLQLEGWSRRGKVVKQNNNCTWALSLLQVQDRRQLLGSSMHSELVKWHQLMSCRLRLQARPGQVACVADWPFLSNTAWLIVAVYLITLKNLANSYYVLPSPLRNWWRISHYDHVEIIGPHCPSKKKVWEHTRSNTTAELDHGFRGSRFDKYSPYLNNMMTGSTCNSRRNRTRSICDHTYILPVEAGKESGFLVSN